ncbi:hypothetical protein AAE478_002562 [Parahypoxylon ruwenzoriense]
MARKTATNVPDAWEDDDWEAQADKAAAAAEKEEQGAPQPQPQLPLSRAERLAQHAESNRRLWESAEGKGKENQLTSPPISESPPEAPSFQYLSSQSEPPLSSTFKPAVTVLSRKPAASKNDSDSEGERSSRLNVQLTAAQLLAKQQEKQRRYDEARAKIFGTPSPGPPPPPSPATTSAGAGTGVGLGTGLSASIARLDIGSSNPSSGTSTPGVVTPPRSADGRGPRGRGRGGRGGGGYRHNDSRGDGNQRPSSQSGAGTRELYDPNYSPKPGFQPERRGNNSNGSDRRSATPREDDQVIRSPRGPDGTGRGGFGFAQRGAKGS